MSLVHPENAWSDMEVTLLPRVTVLSFTQPLKAFAPMDVIFFPVLTFFSFLFPLKAFFATDVTLYTMPFESVMVDGITAVATFFVPV